MTSLQVENITKNSDSYQATVWGKTGKGVVYFGALCAKYLNTWLKLRPKQHSSYVWVNAKGLPLSTSGVYLALKRLAIAAGVQGKFAPQAIRHLNGYNYTSKANLALAQKKLRHKDVSTTARFYAHQNEQEVINATLALSPLVDNI